MLCYITILLLENINKSPGLVFVYSNFRTVEGVEIFSKILDHNGYAKFGTRSTEPKYAIYSGSEDEKENAEHIMLVDLARNDLSRNGHQVKVEKYREVQFFSHVIHLVSKVTGLLHEKATTMQVVVDTFPAGTLSGAPKHKAMQLIEKYEKTNRNFYGGAIGFMDFNGNFNHAIMIRTFLSKNHKLHYQAGAGIVSDSNEENEMQEWAKKQPRYQQFGVAAIDTLRNQWDIKTATKDIRYWTQFTN